MKYFIFFPWLLIATIAIAQNNGKIAGRIVSKNEKAVTGATVSLLRAGDSILVKQIIGNNEGVYRFESVADGKYIIAVTAVGHHKVFSKIIEINPGQSAVLIPPIPLTPVTQNLAGVTVTAKRPLIEQKIDRVILNPDALVSNTGVSALEVLENAPGVTVDKEGTISLKGKDGVMVLIDGRPTQLAGADLVNLLRSMNSHQIDQVEIMTNPPAKYDASGTAGLINIKTKKALNKGYNGSASAAFTQGRYPKTNESFNFNYRNEKINWFTNLGHNYNTAFGTLLMQRKIFDNTDNAIENYFDQTGHRIINGNSINGKIGLDYFVNKKTTVGIVMNGTSASTNSTNTTVTNISNASKEPERKVNAIVDNSSDWKNFGSSINFRTLLNTKGRELTSDLDFIRYHSGNNQLMMNSYFDKDGNPIIKADSLLGHLPQEVNLYSGRVDYIHPLKKGARLEAGIKNSFVKTDNDAAYDSIENRNIVRDVNRSNHFVYEENIQAVYINLNQPLSKKLGVQLGLRMEHTNTKGRQLATGEDFTRQYTQLFPTAYFQYKVNEKNTLLLNYGRRIRRPNYQSLNPFVRFIDRYTFSSGNPNLRPQLSDNVEVSHSWRNRITTTINYTYTANIFDDVIEQRGQEAFRMPANIASHRQFGLAINANTPVTKWWMSSIAFNAFNNHYKGQVSNIPISLAATSFIVNAIQQFKLNKTLTAEVNGRFRSGWYEGLVKAKPVGFIGAGLSQQLMKNKATLRLAVRDILFSQQFKGESKYGNVDFDFREIRDTRTVSIGFTYRFSKGKKLAAAKRTVDSTNEEQERIGDQ
jgi:iron complex outermembrane receptor protein